MLSNCQRQPRRPGPLGLRVSPADLPGTTTHVNDLHINPHLRVCFWGPGPKTEERMDSINLELWKPETQSCPPPVFHTCLWIRFCKQRESLATSLREAVIISRICSYSSCAVFFGNTDELPQARPQASFLVPSVELGCIFP